MDKKPFYRRACHTPILTQTGTMETANSPYQHNSGCGSNPESLQKPTQTGKNVQTPQIVAQAGNWVIFFFFSEHCDNMMLSETLFKELLYLRLRNSYWTTEALPIRGARGRCKARGKGRTLCSRSASGLQEIPANCFLAARPS